MNANFHVMDAAFINDWSKMDADDSFMDEASIFARILDFRNECGCSFDGRGLSLLNMYELQNSDKLQFHINEHFRLCSVTTCPAFISGRLRLFPKTLR